MLATPHSSARTSKFSAPKKCRRPFGYYCWHCKSLPDSSQSSQVSEALSFESCHYRYAKLSILRGLATGARLPHCLRLLADHQWGCTHLQPHSNATPSERAAHAAPLHVCRRRSHTSRHGCQRHSGYALHDQRASAKLCFYPGRDLGCVWVYGHRYVHFREGVFEQG